MTGVALVTGGARGIGAAIANRLETDGFEVVTGDVDPAADVLLDVTDPDGVATVVSDIGPLAVLVNNAGIDDRGYFSEMSPPRWRRLIAVNLEGVFACTHAALPGMRDAGSGRIVNIASEAGRLGSKGDAVYAATKGGVITFTRSIAREAGRDGITVNAVAPGPIDTPLLRDMPSPAIAAVTAATQLRRLGTCEEVAAAVSFLASDEAGYITGEVLGVSGGMVL